MVLQAALGKRESISIFGTDYPTPDNTCIRDYIHVSDLAQAHVLGLEYLLKEGDSEVFNLGNGSGFSVREVIETANKVTVKKSKLSNAIAPPGDPPILVGSSDKATKTLGWHPQYPNKRGNYLPRLAVASKTAWFMKRGKGERVKEKEIKLYRREARFL